MPAERPRRSVTVTASLFGAFALLVVLTCGGVLVLDRLQDQRLELEHSRVLIQRTQNQTEVELRRLLDPINRAVVEAQGWVKRGLVKRYDEEALKALFLPQMATLPQCVSMMVSDMTGYEFLLMRNETIRGPDDLLDVPEDAGVWVTRDSRRDAWGKKSLWALWDAEGHTCVKRWERELDYDPRSRVWHAGPRALNTQRFGAEASPQAAGPIHWTDVDLFFTSRTSGITASVALEDPAGDVVVLGYDLLFSDLSAFTQTLNASKRGKVFVHTDEGLLVGLPRGERFANPQAALETILQPVEGAGLPELREGMRRWRDRSADHVAPARVEADGEVWWVGFRPFTVSPERRLWIGVAIPEGDLVWHNEGNLPALAIGALGLLFASGLALFLSRRFAQPLGTLIEQSDRIASLDLSPGAPTTSSLAEFQRLSDALEAMRRSLATHDAQRLASEAKYRRLIESMPQSYFFYSHGTDGVFTYISPSLTSVLGHDVADFLTHYSEYMTENPINQAAEEATARSLQGIRQPPYHLEIRHKNGSTRLLEVLEVPVLDGEGKVTAVEGLAHDVTEAKAAAREQVIAKERAEAATEAKSQFLANMSHEIRTPLHAILGFTDLLERTDLTSEQRAHLGTVQESSRSLLGLVNEILDFSKVEAGMLELEAKPFEIAEVLSTSVHQVATKAAEKDLEVTVRVADEVPTRVLGDRPRVRQVLVNLLDNAVKFTPKGGVLVTVEADPADGEQQSVRFAVHDTGIGIPANRRGRLFQSFSQIDPSTTRVYGGTGLGLAISRGICEAMGGTLDVESEPGNGSTFTFTIPFAIPPESGDAAAPAEAVRDEASPVDAVDPATLRVLVAEDNRLNLTLALRFLDLLGCVHVDAVTNGAEALEALQDKTYDVALMDVQMPELDGLEVTRRFRAQANNDVRIVAMTASAMEGDREGCLQAGMDGFLTKPLGLETLREVLSIARPKSP